MRTWHISYYHLQAWAGHIVAATRLQLVFSVYGAPVLLDMYMYVCVVHRAGSLQIRQSLESDEGRYECVAENSAGIAYSHAADLYVRGTIFRYFCALLRASKYEKQTENFVENPLKAYRVILPINGIKNTVGRLSTTTGNQVVGSVLTPTPQAKV